MLHAISTGFSARSRWAVAFVAAAVLGVTGCAANPVDGTEAGDPVSNSTVMDGSSTDQAPPITPEAPGSVGPVEQPELPVVEGQLDETIALQTGAIVEVKSISAQTVEAETPGDVAGSAVAVVVRVTNDSAEPLNVSSAVVTLETVEGDLGIPTIAGGASALSGDIAPQASAEGRYLFMLDPPSGRDITISVNYAAGEPIARFTGLTP